MVTEPPAAKPSRSGGVKRPYLGDGFGRFGTPLAAFRQIRIEESEHVSMIDYAYTLPFL